MEFGHRFQKEQVLAFSSVAAPEKAAWKRGLNPDGAFSASPKMPITHTDAYAVACWI